jgi:hypothetical protein
MQNPQPVSEWFKQIYKRAREEVALEPRYRNLPHAYIKRQLREITEEHMWIVDIEMRDAEGNPISELDSAKERYRLAMDYYLGVQ